MNRNLVRAVFLLGVLRSGLLFADTSVEFHRTLPVALTDHIILDVAVPNGNITISSAHAGEMSISATARSNANKVPADFFERGLVVERQGEHVKVHFDSSHAPAADQTVHVAYVIEAPNWIEVNSSVGVGKQTISGVMGPVTAISGSGDVNATYITSTLDVKTGRGDVAVTRVGTAARVDTVSGNINMKDIGPGSVAIVEKGAGRVDVDGISGSFTGTTDAGDLRIAGRVYDDWNLKSDSGNIHIGTTAEAQFDLDAATRSGRLSIENEDVKAPEDPDARESHQKVNGGGKLVRARSVSGVIFIQ